MSTITADLHAHPHAEHGHAGSFWTTYVFSRDHKIIGIQFLFSTLLWFFIGGLLALGVRWQLAWPWYPMPILGNLLYKAEGGQIAPEAYTMLFTMHASIMIFLVIIPILAGAFGNFLIPLMIGARHGVSQAEHAVLLGLTDGRVRGRLVVLRGGRDRRDRLDRLPPPERRPAIHR